MHSVFQELHPSCSFFTSVENTCFEVTTIFNLQGLAREEKYSIVMPLTVAPGAENQ